MARLFVLAAAISALLLYCPAWAGPASSGPLYSGEGGTARTRQLLQSRGSDACRRQFGRQCIYCIRSGPNPRCTGVATPELFTIRSGRPVPKPGVEPRPVKYDPIGARKCRAGYIKSAAGNYACFKCKGDTYSPSLGGTACRKCPPPRRVNSAHTSCTARPTRRPTPKPTKKPTRKPTPAPAPSCVPAKGTQPADPTYDTYLVASGGQTDFSMLNAENYRINGGRGWKPFARPATPSTDFFEENTGSVLVTMPNGQLLAVGGGIVDNAKTGLFFDVASRTYCNTGPHVLPGRNFHQAVVLPDGRALAIGGRASTFDGPKNFRTATAESFTFEGGWEPEASMGTPREMHSAVLLQDGNVLVCGGFSGSAVLATCEVFVTATSAWESTGSMAMPRSNFPMVLLPDGRVLAALGREGALPSAKAEIYTPTGDPANSSWQSIPDAPTARETSQIAVTRRNGRDVVLVIGGAIPQTTETDPDSRNFLHPESLSSVDAFDISANAWLPQNAYGPLALGRHDHVAVVLPGSGDILVIGGYYLPNYCECITEEVVRCRSWDPAAGQSVASPPCETNSVERLPAGGTQWQSDAPLQLGRSRFATAFVSVPQGTVIDRVDT